MTLIPSARLGPYEIVALLGAGGMGEVYRARDTKLGREVAIKVLLPAVANDPDRLARFSREAQVLASLNHPNIAAIYGLEDADGTKALVLELVEGPTLADRIAQGAIPIADAVPIAKQIGEALEAAHEHGIIHRDLKPANIKVRDDARVKVLDFGLAKAMEPAGVASTSASMSPTLSMRATQAGVILGTAAYMSPEQARGSAVDKRADLWAFGVVFYEMLTGTRLFDGATISDTLAHVLTREPDWSLLPQGTPVPIRRLLRRCLEKEPKRRLPDAADIRLEIEDALAAPASELSLAAAVTTPDRRMAPVALATALGTALVVGLAVWALTRPASASPPVMRFGIALPPDQTLAISFNDRDLAISPDGTHLVYTAGAESQLMVRDLARLDAKPLAGTVDARAPFVSPDGRWVGSSNGSTRGSRPGPSSVGP